MIIKWIPLIAIFVAVIGSLSLVGWAIYNQQKEEKDKQKKPSEKPKKDDEKDPWLEKTWVKIGLGYIVLNAGCWLLHTVTYSLWVSNYTTSYLGVHMLIIFLIAVFTAFDGKKHGGFKWLMVLVVLTVIFTSIAQEPIVIENLKKHIPETKSDLVEVKNKPSTSTAKTEKREYRFTLPASGWFPIPKEAIAVSRSWSGFTIDSADPPKQDFLLQTTRGEIFSNLDNRHLPDRSEFSKLKLQSPTGKAITIVLKQD